MSQVSYVRLVAIIFLSSVPGIALGGSNYTYTTINYPGASETHARGINDSGEIVGYYKMARAIMGTRLTTAFLLHLITRHVQLHRAEFHQQPRPDRRLL